MRKRWIGYAVWLLLAACLYFFENNTGTRVILVCSLLFPLFPPLRSLLFAEDEPGTENRSGQQTVRSFTRQETDEPGDVRGYRPGDPIQRIHWKLTAKKGELLVREPEATIGISEEQILSPPDKENGNAPRFRLIRYLIAAILLCSFLLAVIPEARRGIPALCNRIFAASEAVNAYAYNYFPVPENQEIFPASLLIVLLGLLVFLLAVLLRSRLLNLGIMTVLTLFQVYFGLSFPAWINVPLYGLISFELAKRPFSGRNLWFFCLAVLSVSVLVFCLVPGVDPVTESVSEKVRDDLGKMAMELTGTVAEIPDGETETRHVHTQSLETGNREASTDKEFRLTTVEEEQISMPHWMNWMKVILLLLLAIAVVILPFAPFLLLNARRRKAEEARRVFQSDDVSEAVRAIFQQVILWLETTDPDAGNCLYREWAERLPSCLPEGYAGRFSGCAADFEEAVYSSHTLPEEKRRLALELLRETENALWKAADRKQRFRLKYWMCLCE